MENGLIKKSTLDLIGNTPLIKLDKISSSNFNVYGKLEFLQPGGSIKDRVAYQMIIDAYASGKLKKGQTVVEMTSGNMGAGLAVVCKQFGNPFITVMSKGNSPERRKILKALGAEVVLADQIDGIPGKVTGNDINHAAEIAIQLAKEKGAFYADQFNNKSNIKAHFESTGPEILFDLPEVDAFIASIGSGGTFVGCSRFLKSKKPGIKCIAAEPKYAAILKSGKVINSKHIIQGTGYGIVTPFWDRDLADDIITVNNEEVFDMTKLLSHEQGLFVGYSSGANVAAAIKYAKQNKEIKNIATILCDTGYKYTDL
jgi:cysteine synthase A